jgi:hypothetical protein
LGFHPWKDGAAAKQFAFEMNRFHPFRSISQNDTLATLTRPTLVTLLTEISTVSKRSTLFLPISYILSWLETSVLSANISLPFWVVNLGSWLKSSAQLYQLERNSS